LIPCRARASRRSADVVNAIRALAMDAVQKANPGIPACRWAWRRSPKCCGGGSCATIPPTRVADRDRFVLSNGHGSMLQYALLHLTGYDLPMEEIRRFRQLHSRTPGHPESAHTRCRDDHRTARPGLANAVGFALAERLLAADFNRPGHTIVDHSPTSSWATAA
jgi:transketolase